VRRRVLLHWERVQGGVSLRNLPPVGRRHVVVFLHGMSQRIYVSLGIYDRELHLLRELGDVLDRLVLRDLRSRILLHGQRLPDAVPSGDVYHRHGEIQLHNLRGRVLLYGRKCQNNMPERAV
jgi:hypothetical protein